MVRMCSLLVNNSAVSQTCESASDAIPTTPLLFPVKPAASLHLPLCWQLLLLLSSSPFTHHIPLIPVSFVPVVELPISRHGRYDWPEEKAIVQRQHLANSAG